MEELSRHWDRLFGETGRLDHNIETLGAGLSARIDGLDQKFDRRCDALEQKFDRRCDALEQKFDRRCDVLEQKFDRRLDAIDQKFDRRFEAVDKKMDDLRTELSKQFRWTFSTMLALLGMMLTVGAGVATALLRN